MMVYSGTIINFTSENVSSTIAYVKMIITDLSPLMALIIAIGLGLIIFSVIVNTIRGK